MFELIWRVCTLYRMKISQSDITIRFILSLFIYRCTWKIFKIIIIFNKNLTKITKSFSINFFVHKEKTYRVRQKSFNVHFCHVLNHVWSKFLVSLNIWFLLVIVKQPTLMTMARQTLVLVLSLPNVRQVESLFSLFGRSCFHSIFSFRFGCYFAFYETKILKHYSCNFFTTKPRFQF